MRLDKLLKNEYDPVEIDEISVLLSVEALSYCDLDLALESVWQDSGCKDYRYRIDPENPRIPLNRHVHIARSKHTSTKDMQASWNSDGTRHDKKSFNPKIGSRNQVRQIAKQTLNIPSDIALESWDEHESNNALLEEEVSFEEDGTVAYLRIELA